MGATPMRLKLALLALVPIAIFVAYAPVLSNGFVNWDDHDTLYQNPDFNPPRLGTLWHYWHNPQGHLFIPITYTFWHAIARVAYCDGTLRPFGFHLASLLLHATASLLVFAIVRRLIASDLAAAGG